MLQDYKNQIRSYINQISIASSSLPFKNLVLQHRKYGCIFGSLSLLPIIAKNIMAPYGKLKTMGVWVGAIRYMATELMGRGRGIMVNAYQVSDFSRVT